MIGAAIPKLLLVLSILGLFSSTVYSALALIASYGFVRRRLSSSQAAASSFPFLSLLKPLHGNEADLEARLEGFFKQSYPNYEILFCARNTGDAGLQVARRVAERYPKIPVQFLTTGEPAYTNAKVSSLELMGKAARAEILIISDSDVRVGPTYLRDVSSPFADAEVGLVTCLYRGVAEGKSLWSQLEATAMSIEMASGVLVAEWIEGMRFALGPTMAVRRSCLQQIGGFGTLGRYCADDFVLGNRIAGNGYRVVLSGHIIDHVILNESFRQSAKHQIRWMKSTRFSRPKGHLGTALTFSVPFGLGAWLAFLILGMPLAGWAALLWSIFTRVLLAAAIGGRVIGETRLSRTAVLYCLRDFMGFFFWMASYASNRILWRGEVFELLREGVMRQYAGGAGANPIAEKTWIPPRP